MYLNGNVIYAMVLSRAVTWRERDILVFLYLYKGKMVHIIHVCTYTRGLWACLSNSRSYEKQDPSSWDWTRHMGRGYLHAKQGAPARGPSDPSHLHTWLLLWPDISTPSLCTASSPGSHSYWLKTSKGVERIPQLKEKQNHLCQKEVTSSEALVSNYEEPRVTVQALRQWQVAVVVYFVFFLPVNPKSCSVFISLPS